MSDGQRNNNVPHIAGKILTDHFSYTVKDGHVTGIERDIADDFIKYYKSEETSEQLDSFFAGTSYADQNVGEKARLYDFMMAWQDEVFSNPDKLSKLLQNVTVVPYQDGQGKPAGYYYNAEVNISIDAALNARSLLNTYADQQKQAENPTFKTEEFLEYMHRAFDVDKDSYAADIIRKVIAFGLEHYNHGKDDLAYFLSDTLPEVEFKEAAAFCSDDILTSNGLYEKNSILHADEEWQNLGDVNFFEYGGVMVRKDPDISDSYNFFYLVSDGKNRYAFNGTVCDLKEYADEDCIKNLFVELTGSDGRDYADVDDMMKKDPWLCAATLATEYGCGPFEFSPCNCRGQGQYSMSYDDFKVNDQELVDFMTDVGIPDQYIPELQYEATSRFGDVGIESTLRSNDWDEITTYSHEKLMNGHPVEIKDNRDGSSVKLDPDEYSKNFNGEFPVNPHYSLEVDYKRDDDEASL